MPATDPVSSPRPFRLAHGRTQSHPPQGISWASFGSRILSNTPLNQGLVPTSSVIISATNPPSPNHELSTSHRLPLSLLVSLFYSYFLIYLIYLALGETQKLQPVPSHTFTFILRYSRQYQGKDSFTFFASNGFSPVAIRRLLFDIRYTH